MRKVFFSTLCDLAEQDPRIMVLTGDLGFGLMEPFREKYPERFINVGVAEQDLVGIATGLADSGYIPYVYSITPFAVLRPYEFIRNGPIYHQLKVRIIGAGEGFDYPHDGITHMGIDDIGVLRVQPGISIFVPADYEQSIEVLRKTHDIAGPVYYRLSKNDQQVVPGLNGEFEIGKGQLIGDGSDLLMIAMGSITLEGVKAIETLKQQGITCTLMVVASIAPPPFSSLLTALPRFKHVITIEANYINGGLGSMVAEFIAENQFPCRLIRCGIRQTPDGRNGSHPYMLSTYRISSAAIVEEACRLIQR